MSFLFKTEFQLKGSTKFFANIFKGRFQNSFKSHSSEANFLTKTTTQSNSTQTQLTSSLPSSSSIWMIWFGSSGWSCSRCHMRWAACRLAIFLLLPLPTSRYLSTAHAIVNCRSWGRPTSISVSYVGGGQRRAMHISWSQPIGLPDGSSSPLPASGLTGDKI